ncbi:MAG TPA: ribonuclease P [Candidatus Woesearchaeota archaeon]|nr:ribonuclease P [Candidatus Woesearchaeota archaeon]
MKSEQKKIADERIRILFREAEKALKENKKMRSRRYVQMARKVSTKYQIPLRHLKRKFCKKCSIFFIPGKTLRVRTRKKDCRVIYTCMECGTIQRYRYVKEKKKI